MHYSVATVQHFIQCMSSATKLQHSARLYRKFKSTMARVGRSVNHVQLGQAIDPHSVMHYGYVARCDKALLKRWCLYLSCFSTYFGEPRALEVPVLLVDNPIILDATIPTKRGITKINTIFPFKFPAIYMSGQITGRAQEVDRVPPIGCHHSRTYCSY